MKKYLPPTAVFLLLLAAWELAVHIFHIDKFILPAPSQIGLALYRTFPLLWEHSLQTLWEALLGFILAVAGGTALGLVMGVFPVVRKAFYPLLVVSQTIPIVAIAPLLMIWFGYETLPKVIVAALVCFFPITVSLVEGLEAADPDMERLLEAMGASPWQIMAKVQFPGAMPAFFAGLKISATYSIMGAVIGEWLGASRGLGVYMTRSMHSFLTERVFASIVVVSVLSLLLFSFIDVLARLFMPWYYEKLPKQD